MCVCLLSFKITVTKQYWFQYIKNSFVHFLRYFLLSMIIKKDSFFWNLKSCLLRTAPVPVLWLHTPPFLSLLALNPASCAVEWLQSWPALLSQPSLQWDCFFVCCWICLLSSSWLTGIIPHYLTWILKISNYFERSYVFLRAYWCDLIIGVFKVI